MLQQSFTRMHVKRLLTRIYATGLVMRFSIVGLTVALLVAGGLAWFIEAQLTDLLLTTVAARAATQVSNRSVSWPSINQASPPATSKPTVRPTMLKRITSPVA